MAPPLLTRSLTVGGRCGWYARSVGRTGMHRQRATQFVRARARRMIDLADARCARVGVLAYHRVTSPVADPWNLAVSPQHFEDHVRALTAQGPVVRLDQAIGRPLIARLAQRRPMFALTFDDGYDDNLEQAVPILERHDTPATVFIATGLVGQPGFWWDVLADLAFTSGAAPDALVDAAVGVDLISSDRGAALVHADTEHVHDEIYAAIAQLTPRDILPVLHELAGRSGVPVPAFAARPVSTDELVTLASHPLITIGVHTVNHSRLTLLSDAEVHAELTDAARHLDELLGAELRPLAYPFGALSPATVQVARAAGFAHAVTTSSRWVGLRDDPLTTPRLHARDLDHDEFTAWLSAA